MRKHMALAASLVLLMGVAPSARGQTEGLKACERFAEVPPGMPVNVELTTVTDTEVVLTWLTCANGSPLPSDTTVVYAYLESPQQTTYQGDEKTAFHYARISKLEPGRAYDYSVFSNGLRAVNDSWNPGVFTTLTPPSGKELFSFAVMADVHIGEEVSGLATSTPTEFPPSYRSKKPYSALMLDAAVDAVNRSGASLTLLPADNTSHAELAQLRGAAKILSKLKSGYLIARGAHDRPGQSPEEPECPPDLDCFRQVFHPKVKPRRDPQHLPEVRVQDGWTFIALDSVNLASGVGELSDDQLEWLRGQLERAAASDSPVVIFFHHPVAEYSSAAAIPPVIFGVNQGDAQQFLQLIGAYDVRLVINAHTHRNWIAYSPHTGRMPILEVGPTKEYPGGYSLFRVFEGGILRSWWPLDCGFCNEWREHTRGEYLSLYRLYTLGSLRDRNFVHLFDSPDVPGVPSLPLGLWPPLVPGTA
ncbi:MAG: hypothetical protein ABR505_10115 [Actinomycetota bacterium]